MEPTKKRHKQGAVGGVSLTPRGWQYKGTWGEVSMP